MKNLKFLENDYQCPASDEDIRHAKRHLHYCGIDRELIDSMTIHYQFNLMPKDEAYKLLFNKNNTLVTYSMYIQGSDSAFDFFMVAAGRSEIKGITYIDTSGELVEHLNSNLRDNKDAVKIMCGINQNNILTFVYEPTSALKRIKIEFNDYFGECVKLEDTEYSKNENKHEVD